MTSTPPPPQPPLSGGDQIFVHGDKTASRRTQSFSSSPSLSSNSSFGSSLSFRDDHTPRSPLQFMGVPFSWEKIPGIPKQLYASKKISDEPSLCQLLPLPPVKKQSFRDEFSPRKSAGGSFREDPFFAALVECSKEDRHNGESKVWKSSSKIVTKSLSDRFGFIGMYATCKTSSVSESIVNLPRSRNYDLLSRRSRR